MGRSTMAMALWAAKGQGEDGVLFLASLRARWALWHRKWRSPASRSMTWAGNTVADVGDKDDGDRALRSNLGVSGRLTRARLGLVNAGLSLVEGLDKRDQESGERLKDMVRQGWVQGM
ncbi:hypothetical protein QYE76_020576 [Lolium multiflorum]|uniref:Uncharacterized protein n=1 Tax=Lolium multiflorum TaxID=4521 RepID=A0AAD8R8U9_LOLMU|nr:hypothetical protein QYE76_020576 [Lolium multiflorum]